MATFTPQDVITEVRRLVQDQRTSYRYSDDHILGVINQVLRRIALIRPDLFAYTATVTCVVGATQSAPADSIRIIDVAQADPLAGVVAEVSQETLDLMFSTWRAGTTGPARNWMRSVRNPNQFYVYPPSAAGQELAVEYAKSPKVHVVAEPVELISDAYFPVVVDGTVWLLESVDNEHVNSGRAKMFQDSFVQSLGVTVQNKPVTDTPEGGEQGVLT